jgi:hypothetical protein
MWDSHCRYSPVVYTPNDRYNNPLPARDESLMLNGGMYRLGKRNPWITYRREMMGWGRAL